MFDFLLATAATATSLGGPADIWAAIVKDFSNITEPAAFAAFVQVLLIDLVLAGDNAIVVGALAAGLPADQRKKVILIGVLAALVLRIIFALMVTWLLGIVGLVLAGEATAAFEDGRVVPLRAGELLAVTKRSGERRNVLAVMRTVRSFRTRRPSIRVRLQLHLGFERKRECELFLLGLRAIVCRLIE